MMDEPSSERAAIGIAGSIFLLVTAGIVIAGMTYYGGDMLQRAQTESKIGQHARQASTFGNAVAKFVEAKGDGLSDGRHVYEPADLKGLGFLNDSFDETTPWGETLVVYLYKNGDEISGVISEYGEINHDAVKTIMDDVNDETLRALKLRVAQKRVEIAPASDDVPGVGKDGLADGVKGMYEDVDISTYVSDGTPRYVSLMDVDGLGSIPSIEDPETLVTHYITIDRVYGESVDGSKNYNCWDDHFCWSKSWSPSDHSAIPDDAVAVQFELRTRNTQNCGNEWGIARAHVRNSETTILRAGKKKWSHCATDRNTGWVYFNDHDSVTLYIEAKGEYSHAHIYVMAYKRYETR